MAPDTLTRPAPKTPDQPGRPAGFSSGPVVVVTGWRDPDRVRWMQTLSSAVNDPDSPWRHVVAFNAAPQVRKAGELLRDLLFALGKSPHVTGGAYHDDGDFDVPAAWLLARRTKEIVVVDAPQVALAVQQTLLELAYAVGARVWLIAHHERDDLLDDLADDHDATRIDLDDFDRIWDRPTTAPRIARPRPASVTATALPHSSSLTFRADCRRLLDETVFGPIDELYRTEFRKARDEMTERGTDLDHEFIGGLLRRRIRSTATPDTALVTARAVEAAALRLRFQVDIDTPVLLNAAERNPRPGRVSAGDLAALDAYARTMPAATCALALLEIPPNDIAELTIGDIPLDASEVTTEAGTVPVPEPIRPLLQAQRLARQFAGAPAEAALLLTERGEPAKVQRITRTIKVAEVETGVRLSRQRTDRKALTTNEWLVAHGITIRKIGTAAPRRRKRA